MSHYEAALPFRDMIVGVGLDSDEYMRPPSLFAEVFHRARRDGFKLTCHCDVATHNTHDHIRQALTELGGTGADRLDHGLDAVEKPELMRTLRDRGIGTTICPWAYLRHEPVHEVFPRIKALHVSRIRFAIGSDDPAYMEDVWIVHNYLLFKKMGGFNNNDLGKMAQYAIEVSWAADELKHRLFSELQDVVAKYAGSSA